MKKCLYPRLAFLALLSTAFACALPFGNQPPAGDQVATVVAATMQALTPVSAGDATPTAGTTGLLPRSFYFLGTDNNTGLLQVFRIEKDGKTQKQLTFEPVAVSDYDVSLVDGSVVYVANNQLLLIQADGSGRLVLVEGGAMDPNDPFATGLSKPVFSPDAQTIAYSHKGLNLYAVAAGTSTLVLEKQRVDPATGASVPAELYLPEKYSPDGSKILITAAIPNSDGITGAIFDPQTRALVRLTGAEGVLICCGDQEWTSDSSAFYAASATVGMFGSGLWKVDAASGVVTTVLPGDAGNGNFNLADEAYLAPNGQLYFFFAAAPITNEIVQRIPLQLVSSAPDGVTGRMILNSETYQLLNDALWAPDASLVVVAHAPIQEVYVGGQAEVVYLDGRAGFVLTNFAQQMKWGP